MIELVARYILPAAYAVLPPQMASPRATAFLLSVGLLESRFEHRAQVGGPARGLWQFERSGVLGVLTHARTDRLIGSALTALCYDAHESPGAMLEWIEHNDVLACVFARLLLYTDPRALPDIHDAERAWQMYLDLWRPGRPHHDRWFAHYATAWGHVTTERTLNA